MVCTIDVHERPQLNNPVLIEGLPGIGFVANITTLHLIRELKAKLFADVISSSFQDLAVTTERGSTRSPINELYYYKSNGCGRDLIIWYGNTQALTTMGQYELCGRILDTVEELGCRYIITLGGYKQEEMKATPQIYSAATDTESMREALELGTKMMVGQIYGVAGILIGLARLRNIRGFSLLIETLGTSPDAKAAHQAVITLSKFLNFSLDLSGLDSAAEETKRILESFGILRRVVEEKKREEQRFRWFI